MRVTVRRWLTLLALTLSAITLTACTQSIGGAAAPDPVAPISASAPNASTATKAPTAATTRPNPPASASGPSSTMAPTPATTTAITTVTITTSASDSPPPPTDLSGEVYGFVKKVDVDNSEITLDKIDWFTGAAAAAACAEDGITSTDNNRCTGYYYRNVNPALRVVGVSPHATIATLANGVNPVQSDLADVARRIGTSGGESNTYHLVVTDGLVTELTEMYHP